MSPTSSLEPGAHWVTVQLLGSGFAVVEMWYNNEEEDLGPFAEPWDMLETRFPSYELASIAAEKHAAERNLKVFHHTMPKCRPAQTPRA